MLFHNSKNRINWRQDDPVKFSRGEIQWVHQHKYLGMILTAKLNWEAHVNHIIQKAHRGLNIMRAICGTEWGAEPATLLIMYKAIVRSHLEFGIQVLATASKKNLLKLNHMQNAALRIITGCMKCTPINALLGETGELHLETRRILLDIKFTFKNLGERENPLWDFIFQLAIKCKQKKFWKNKRCPYVVQAIEEIGEYRQKKISHTKLPCYTVSLVSIFHRISWTKTPENANGNQSFNQFMIKYFPNHVRIFTDGSRCGL